MFRLPEGAPWWAVLAVVVLVTIVAGVTRLVRHVWPQNSRDRKELLQHWRRGDGGSGEDRR
ncbi:hypothetical protein [Streptomyces sp. CB01201]|uniref:hypothetical protein n=1 Tax=Streptomyces sp. CB01201 TaxID=2020324 RepID=UPI00131D0519|nr:hypothetical protein [Streptomyces sp. CB01201]